MPAKGRGPRGVPAEDHELRDHVVYPQKITSFATHFYFMLSNDDPRPLGGLVLASLGRHVP